MKYELFFLNNIHDSMEMVNAELDPFLDLSSQGVFDELCMKHIILNLANFLELLVKYRLEQEHWTLIFSDLNKAKYSDYLAGDFISVDVKSGICRLKNICEMKYVFISSIHIYQYRNRLMHYTLISTFEQIIEDVANAMREIAEFVEKEVIEDLPKEAQKDFQSSIADYRKYAAILKEFKL
ncbi:hypothetical protein AALB16_11315 [Lachnospiraceae bacterium 62-35]